MKSMFYFKITNNKEKIEKYRKMMGFFYFGGLSAPLNHFWYFLKYDIRHQRKIPH